MYCKTCFINVKEIKFFVSCRKNNAILVFPEDVKDKDPLNSGPCIKTKKVTRNNAIPLDPGYQQEDIFIDQAKSNCLILLKASDLEFTSSFRYIF